MKSIIREYEDWLIKEKAKQSQLEELYEETKENFKINRDSLRNYQKASVIIKQIGIQTQQQLQFMISETTSLALQSVFPNPYELKVEFVERRNQIECDIYLARDEKQYNPSEDVGGGVVDISCFSLRISCFSLQGGLTPSFILDEPFKNLSKEYRKPAAEMLKELSRKLNIQFIIVTHEPTISEIADKTFLCYLKKSRKHEYKVSQVIEQ